MIASSRDDDRVGHRLSDLRDFAADAAYTVSLGLAAYLADSPEGRVLRNNGRHIVVQVATVVEKLPDDFTAQYSQVPWVQISRMRNLVAHHYDRVDDRLVFSTLSGRIPELAAVLGL